MRYSNIYEAEFISRPNRFTAYIKLDEKEELCHVKNTGRLRELLIPGAKVYVSYSEHPKRKTKYSLIAVEKEGILYNIDSQAPNRLAYEWIEKGNMIPDAVLIKPEKTFHNSRFDLYVETASRKAFIEVKGVTLNQDGIGFFPDAPTERGRKHVLELIDAVKEGYEAYLLFVVKFNPAFGFQPNTQRQPEFTKSLIEAEKAGVKIKAVCCQVRPDEIYIEKEIKTILSDIDVL